MISGMTLSSGVSVEIGAVRGTESEGRIQMRATLYSILTSMAGVTFSYRKDFLDAWHNDAVILSIDNGFIHNNELCCLPCSSEGSETTFVWDYTANGIATGSRCQVKASVIPSASALLRAGKFTIVEGISKNDARTIDRIIEGNAICIDDEGWAVIVDNHTVSRVSPDDGRVVLLAGGLNHPKSAFATGRGSCLILDDDYIREISNEGATIATFSIAGIVSEGASLSCDVSSGNILLAGGKIPKVYELVWRPPTVGTILWTYGQATPGSGAGFLDNPRYATYGEGLETILICDYGNNRVVTVDRASIPEEVVTINSVIVGTTNLPMYHPIRCSQIDDIILICEEEGELETFSTNANSHPAMARAGVSMASGKNALSQYSGFKFVPIIRSIK
jgi:hypothetical protein